LHAALNAEDSGAEAAELIRSLVEEVTLTPEDGQLRIDPKGELARILDLAADSKKPATQRRNGPEQIKDGCGGLDTRFSEIVSDGSEESRSLTAHNCLNLLLVARKLPICGLGNLARRSDNGYSEG
jgi:hypothetical protein